MPVANRNTSSAHYPWVDVLKFVCCVGVVAVHARPFEYLPAVRVCVGHFFTAFIAVFFILSALLLGTKLRFDATGKPVLLKFCKRLAVLYLSWTVLLAPLWVYTLMSHYPDDWLRLLLPKILLTGAPSGSWFILSLLYGTVIAYCCNRWLGKWPTLVLAVLVDVYYVGLHFRIFEDFLHIGIEYKIFNSFFLPMRALLWVDIGLLAGQRLGKIQTAVRRRLPVAVSVALAASLLTAFAPSRVVTLLAAGVLSVALVALAVGCPAGRRVNPAACALLRKQSILIYFFHFAMVFLLNAVCERLHTYPYGLRGFAIVLAASWVFSYAVVKLSPEIKPLRLLY